jgi:hypothetical protein
MSIILSDIKIYTAAVFPENDAVTNIGGAHDFTKKCQFSDFSGTWQVVSDSTADDYPTSRALTLYYRDFAGAILNETVLMDGTTFALGVSNIERMMKGVKSGGAFTGSAAIISQTPFFSGTLPAQTGLSADQIKFPSGASAVTGTYQQMVFRGAYGGLGDTKLVEIIDYDGATKIATVNRTVTGEFDNTTVFEVYEGMFLDKTPNEITEVVRVDYDSSADVPVLSGGSDRDFYVKVFFEHTDASASGLSATSCVVREAQDPTGLNTFAIGTALNDTVDNGAFNRQTAPSSGVTSFDNSDKNVPSGQIMAPGDRIAVWIKLHRVAGAVAVKSFWMPQFRFQTT